MYEMLKWYIIIALGFIGSNTVAEDTIFWQVKSARIDHKSNVWIALK